MTQLTLWMVAPALVLWLSACVAAATPTPTPTPTPQPPFPLRAIRVDYPITPPDVPMVNQDGQPTTLSDFRGRPVLIFFANIRCEDDQACVDGLTRFGEVKRALGSSGDEVAFVMVGMDRTADAPEALKRHLSQFDPSFIGLTAERADMRQLALRFGIHSYVRSDGALAPHAPFIYLLDRQGRLLYFLPDGLATMEIVEAVRRTLDEQ